MIFEDIQIPNLDTANEKILVEEARLAAFNASGGKLNDFSEGSPLAALLEAQAFCGGELLYYMNKLVPTIALQFYKNAGVQRRIGTKAKVLLTFRLRNSSSIPFTIPSGFQVGSSGNNELFVTTRSLTISPGNLTGRVEAESVEVGSNKNIPAYTITVITKPLSNLQSVYNEQSAQGGTDRETLQETIERGNVEIRLRGLVSADDYERSAENVVGVGSRFKAIGNLAQDTESYQLGAVHLFGIDSNGNPLTQAQVFDVANKLRPSIHLSSTLYVSPMNIQDIELDVILVVNPENNITGLANRVWNAIYDYINPKTFEIGQPVLMSEVEYHLRKVEGIARIEQVQMNNNHLNVAVANQFTVAKVSKMNLKLISKEGLELVRDVFYEARR